MRACVCVRDCGCVCVCVCICVYLCISLYFSVLFSLASSCLIFLSLFIIPHPGRDKNNTLLHFLIPMLRHGNEGAALAFFEELTHVADACERSVTVILYINYVCLICNSLLLFIFSDFSIFFFSFLFLPFISPTPLTPFFSTPSIYHVFCS